MAYPVEIRKVYDLEIYPITVMPGDYTSVTVLGIIDPDSARLITDIDALHVAAFPFLPPGSVDDANSYTYIKAKLNNGIVTALSMGWINQNTITEKTRTKIYGVIDDVDPSDLDRVRECLVMNGFTKIAFGLNPSIINTPL